MDEHTRLDRTAKRRYEALTGRLWTGVEEVGNKVWTVPSRSNPDDFHIVYLEHGKLVCSCPGGTHGQPCVHTQAVLIYQGNAIYSHRVSMPQSPYPARKQVPLV